MGCNSWWCNGSYTTDIFTATSGQTAFTLSASVSNENNLIVFVDGVFQAQNTYSVSGTTLTFATGIVLDRVVTVYHVEPVSIGTPSDGTVTSAKLSGALTTPSDLTVTGDLNATLATAAQPNITSVGTLTGLEIATSASDTGVDLTINGNKSSNGAVGSIIFENASDSVAMIRASRVGGNNDAADMQFFTQATGGSNTERMRISSAGLVGIGTNSPSSRLDIVHNNNNPLRLQNSTGVIVKTQFEDNASRQAEIALNTGSITFSNGTSSVTERMRIDSSGKAIFKGVTENELYAQFLSAGASSTVSGYVGRASSVVSGGTATDLGVGGGAGNLVFAAGGSTEKMRIDSSGNVGIGLTNPSDYYSTSLVVNANNNGITLVSPTNAASYIMFADGTSSQEEQYRGYIEYSHSIDTLISRSAGAIRFLTGGSNERMRIDSAGNVLINQTSSNLTYGKLQVSAGGETAGHGGIVGFFDTDGSVASSNLIQLLSFSGDTDATGGQFIRFRDSNSVMGSVSAASGTTVAYNTSSDRRMKENIVDASSQLDVINNIQVREFDWKNNGHHEVGMIAQELNDVIPNVVQEGGDDVTEQPWGVDYGKLTPYLIKAIQELSDKVDNQQTIIDNLTTRIETLEG